ncbi:uncharacterized protein LOC134276144 [Saccostrea cucullata]|uniref:uncharacterized protein LOC134276144 n=1 Tax=Saccostrea cuccullata TaxID=36930 RepID=UPI002ED19AE3
MPNWYKQGAGTLCNNTFICENPLANPTMNYEGQFICKDTNEQFFRHFPIIVHHIHGLSKSLDGLSTLPSSRTALPQEFCPEVTLQSIVSFLFTTLAAMQDRS